MRSRAITALKPLRAQSLGWQRAPLPQYRFQQRRLQSQSITLQDGTAIRRQDVIFTRPKAFSFRRVATTFAYGFGIYLTIKYVPRLAGFDIQIEIEDGEAVEVEQDKAKRLQEGVELSEEDLEADEDSLFIPLTWAQALPRKYYKGADPEWQEFIKISKDGERKDEIWQLMIDSFMIFASQTGIIAHRLGGGLNVDKHWLDITFPDGPPVEYMRKGLEIGDGYLALSQQRIASEKQHRILRALWPTALLSSAYASAKMYATIEWKQLGSYLGFTSINKDGTSFDDAFKQMAAQFAKNKMSKPQTDPASSSSSGSGSTGAGASETAAKALWPLPTVPVPSSGGTEADSGSKLKHAMAASAFARTLMKNWTTKDKIPPRGTFYVHGLIQLRGSKGRMLFDVVGVFDPKQNKYIHMQASVKNFKRANQVPRGGA